MLTALVLREMKGEKNDEDHVDRLLQPEKWLHISKVVHCSIQKKMNERPQQQQQQGKKRSKPI